MVSIKETGYFPNAGRGNHVLSLRSLALCLLLIDEAQKMGPKLVIFTVRC